MKLLREPLLHFVVVGAVLFGAYAWLNRGAGEDPDRSILITEREVAWLTETWSRQWQRPPTAAEMQGLVADYLRETLLEREARALELDRDDLIVRRRLAQKMDFILADTARIVEPTDAELHALYDGDRSRFDAPPVISFATLYFSTDKRGDRAWADARDALARLSRAGAGADSGLMGDASLLPDAMQDADQLAIAGVFGQAFAEAVIALDPGPWRGPVESAFGLHLVRITARREAQPRAFEAVRESLAVEWQRRKEAEAKRDYFRGLLDRYDINATDSVRPLVEPALATLRGDAG
ncbi:MAG: peptidyl-prolyl cis-trans isomerase [Steroidobacteraceae bacterium]